MVASAVAHLSITTPEPPAPAVSPVLPVPPPPPPVFTVPEVGVFTT